MKKIITLFLLIASVACVPAASLELKVESCPPKDFAQR